MIVAGLSYNLNSVQNIEAFYFLTAIDSHKQLSSFTPENCSLGAVFIIKSSKFVKILFENFDLEGFWDTPLEPRKTVSKSSLALNRLSSQYTYGPSYAS